MSEKEIQKTDTKETAEPKAVRKSEAEKMAEVKKELEREFNSTQKELEEVSFEIAQLERLFTLKTYERQLRGRLSSLNEEYRSLDKN
jgi:hypothetical protein